MTTTTFNHASLSNEHGILVALAAGEPRTAAQIATYEGVKLGRTSIYAKLGKMVTAGLLVRKVTKKNDSVKGQRVEFRLSAKGKKTLAKI